MLVYWERTRVLCLDIMYNKNSQSASGNWSGPLLFKQRRTRSSRCPPPKSVVCSLGGGKGSGVHPIKSTFLSYSIAIVRTERRTWVMQVPPLRNTLLRGTTNPSDFLLADVDISAEFIKKTGIRMHLWIHLWPRIRIHFIFCHRIRIQLPLERYGPQPIPAFS